MKIQLDQSRCSSAEVEVPAGFCRKLADSLVALKEQLIAKYEEALPGRRHLVCELIAEAETLAWETLAWETPFPHLFLPDFAELRLAEVLTDDESAFARAV